MSEEQKVFNPVLEQVDKEKFPLVFLVGDDRGPYINQRKPYMVELELTSKCAGSCKYCYASSTTALDITIPTERLLRLIDEAEELGVKKIGFQGGDPQNHPDWFRVVSYAAEKGIKGYFITSGLLSKGDIKKLCELGDALEGVTIHIDSINPEHYAIIHSDPKTLELKMQGYRNLLEAGYPPEKIGNCMTVIRPNLESIPETIDWYVDEMGSKCILLILFKSEGFGSQHYDWEPTVAEFKRAAEYRAKKLGDFWLDIGSMDAQMYYCRSTITVQYDGSVSPCPCVRDLKKGNIHQESLKDIFMRSRDELLYNHEIKGPCGLCDHKDICFGCRATAYHYTGDVTASDPKCFLNPEAKDSILQCRFG